MIVFLLSSVCVYYFESWKFWSLCLHKGHALFFYTLLVLLFIWYDHCSMCVWTCQLQISNKFAQLVFSIFISLFRFSFFYFAAYWWSPRKYTSSGVELWPLDPLLREPFGLLTCLSVYLANCLGLILSGISQSCRKHYGLNMRTVGEYPLEEILITLRI